MRGDASPLPHGLPADEARPLPLPAVRALYVALQVPRVVELAAADVTGERAWKGRTVQAKRKEEMPRSTSPVCVRREAVGNLGTHRL